MRSLRLPLQSMMSIRSDLPSLPQLYPPSPTLLTNIPSNQSITMGGGVPINVAPIQGGFLTGKALIFPLSLVISLFFLWGFSYGLLDVLNKHFQNVLGISRLESTGLQVMYFGGGYLCFSPIAAEVLKRKGYKITILMGLSLYALGAVMFWVRQRQLLLRVFQL